MKYFLAIIIMSCMGCANLDYGDLHYSRTGNWKAEMVVFTEHVEDPNGHSDVTIIIIGPDINHDDMAGKLAEGIVRGLK